MMIRIGTRESYLAIKQAEMVQSALAELFPELDTVLVPMTSSGDQILDKPLADIGGKGLFCKELDRALLDDKIDCAVHSLKDVETVLPHGMELGAFLPRGSVADGLVSPQYKTLDNLPQGAKVGTASQRRKCQLLAVRPDLNITLIRGNVRTRLAKLDNGEYDAIVLAVAGLHRTGLADRITEHFDTEDFVPACGQGALTVQVCTDCPPEIKDKIAKLNHPDTAIAVTAERAILGILDGTCHTPIGAYVSPIDGGLMRIDACMGDDNGALYRQTQVCPPDDIMATAHDVAHMLLDDMGQLDNTGV